MIIAVFDFNIFNGKMILAERIPEIRVPIVLPLTLDWLHESLTPESPNRHPIFTFEWERQLTRFKHKYTLKKIEL